MIPMLGYLYSSSSSYPPMFFSFVFFLLGLTLNEIKHACRKLCVICWIVKARRPWSSQFAKMLLTTLPGLSGLSADWVFCRFSFFFFHHSKELIFFFSFFYWCASAFINWSRCIKRNGLKLYKVFNKPFGAIRLLLICGK